MKMKMVAYDRYQGANLVAANTANEPKVQSKFIVFRDQAEDGEVIAIWGLAPWAKTIVGPGTGSEELQYITPDMGDGYFLYEPVVGSGSAKWNVSVGVMAWQNQASATITDTKTGSGITTITNRPIDTIAAQRANELRSPPLIVVGPGQTFMVLWSLIQAAVAGPIDQRYAIGGGGGTKSVNYAGVAVAGRRIPSACFEKLVAERGW